MGTLVVDLDKALNKVILELQDEDLVLDVRPLDPGDLKAHAEKGPIEPTSVTQRMRTVHHSIARMEAAGVRPPDISRIIGYNANVIYLLHSNPAYQELVAHYEEKADAEAHDLSERIFYAGMDALDALHEKILDPDAAIPIRELRKITMDLADRSGHSPVKRSERVNYHIGLTPEELEEAKRGTAKPSTGARTEHVSAPSSGGPELSPPAEKNRGQAEVGGTGRSGAVPQLASTAGRKTERAPVRAKVWEIPPREASAGG